MEIHGTYPTAYMPSRSTAPRSTVRETAAGDQVKTGKDARLLALSLPALKEELLPRPAVMARFAGIAEQPMDLNDRLIDTIISRI